MYLVPVTVKKSDIEGQGVFALRKIKKSEIVWKFDPQHDKSLSQSDFEKLDKDSKAVVEKVGYLSSKSNNWIYPPENDSARFTNHSAKNNLSVVLDESMSAEPFFLANRDINEEEELTVNYSEFGSEFKDHKPDWM